MDGVTVRIDNPAESEDNARYAQQLGFNGKLCIHPARSKASGAASCPRTKMSLRAQVLARVTATAPSTTWWSMRRCGCTPKPFCGGLGSVSPPLLLKQSAGDHLSLYLGRAFEDV